MSASARGWNYVSTLYCSIFFITPPEKLLRVLKGHTLSLFQSYLRAGGPHPCRRFKRFNADQISQTKLHVCFSPKMFLDNKCTSPPDQWPNQICLKDHFDNPHLASTYFFFTKNETLKSTFFYLVIRLAPGKFWILFNTTIQYSSHFIGFSFDTALKKHIDLDVSVNYRLQKDEHFVLT